MSGEKAVFDKLKLIELDLLRAFIDICEKHNLKYFLLGGSCLGAVRHKGFIPWDDDIDVGLLRDDYERFLAIAQKELPENIFLQTRKTDSEYPMNFAKLRNSNTTFIEKSIRNKKINHGVYIDIFPIDGFTDNKIKRRWFLLKKRLYNYRSTFLYDLDFQKSIANYLKKVIAYAFAPSVEKTIIKLDKMYKSFDYRKESMVANQCGAWGEKEIVPKEYFGEGIEGLFEDIKVTLPAKYHEYLTHLYGNYMTPPPPEKREGHHYYTIMDLEKSYKEYIK